ncbi:uncharacterized protein LOC6526976 isoform X3 [Drosophila yakuba]|uniref:Uncharacterized protein, isoform D n=1 Tax=Drosophila yakuba TaxID=7245 RepID=B4NZV7_DROYA|nr:uncharacterized protein LOC6526976 isoform X3 [Drosophila yakuba]EDW87784.2 uncharacterized protein Dyak_GE18376, isoform D [Drosophila yakuba]
MHLNTLQLALIILSFVRLEAQANVQNNGWQKVLSDDFRRERDKSSARTRRNPQEELRLRHEQHHLRLQQHQMAWELELQRQLQQHLQEQQPQQSQQSRPVRHHQHKSHSKELAKEKPIRQAQSFGDDKAKTVHKRRLHYNEYDNEDLELHTIETGDQGTFSPRQWQQIEIAHRRQKEQHQLQLLAQRQQQRQLLTTTTTTTTAMAMATTAKTTEPNDAKSEDNDVSAAKTLEDNDGHDVENIYARNYVAAKVGQKKEEHLGTPEAVIKARRLHAQKQKSERALAHAHMNQVLKEATCRVPQKRCQLVQQDPSKIYTPHCTILHRCSEDSGCCPSRSQICAAKSTHNVELHFFVKSSKHRSVIEKRTFVNHTECHCIERSTYNEETAMAHYGQSVVRATILSCTCPKSFEKILQDDGQCRCDCSSGNYDCDWLKRGNEHFAMNDRKCIQQGRCKPPTCEFGPYMDKHGRCPKQHEQPSYNAMS